MFKNPLKYQQGGAAPSQQEQQVLAAFIQWLPKRVKEFQGMQPEQIAQALDGMSKTPEGKKQLQQLMTQFQQEMQGGSQAFKQGGKIHDFICKHAKGGALKGCGCKQEGGSIRPGFEYLGENVSQDRNNPNFFEIISHGYRINGQDVAVPTKSGAFRMGIDKDNPGAWDGGKRVYNQDQFNNIRNFYEDLLPNANKVQGPEERLAGMENGGVVKGQDGIPKVRQPHDQKNYFLDNTPLIVGQEILEQRDPGLAQRSDRYVFDPKTGKVVGKQYVGESALPYFTPALREKYDQFRYIYDDKWNVIGEISKRKNEPYVRESLISEQRCGGKVAKASDGSDGIPQARNAKAARRAASKNTVSVGNSGRAKNRKIGAATDKFGGQHLYEDSVIDGSWSDVYVDVPHPGDTIVTQSFPVAGGNDTATRTYPMGSEEYESVMSRMRPAFRMFFPQYKCGGNIKKKESSKVIKGQNGFLNLWQSAYDSKFGKGLRNFMFGTDSDLSNEEYVKKHGYSKPIMGMPPAVKISYIPEGVYGSTRMAEQAAKAAKEAAKFKHVSPLDGGRLGHTIKDVSGVHLKNSGGKV